MFSMTALLKSGQKITGGKRRERILVALVLPSLPRVHGVQGQTEVLHQQVPGVRAGEGLGIMSSELAWQPRAGGQYRDLKNSVSFRITRIVRATDEDESPRWDQIYGNYLDSDGNLGMAARHDACGFVMVFVPEDASPLPALVEALKAARPHILDLAPSYHSAEEVLKQIDAALIAAGEKV